MNTLTETHLTHLDLDAYSFEPALDIIIHALTVEKYRKAPSAAMRACRSAIFTMKPIVRSDIKIASRSGEIYSRGLNQVKI